MKGQCMQIVHLVIAIFLVLTTTQTLYANEHYVEIGITQSNATLEVPSHRAVLGNTIDIEGSTPLTLVRASAGIIFNPYFAIEGMLATGLAEEDVISGPATDTNGAIINYDVTMQTTLFAVTYAIFQYPILENLNIQAKAGYGYVNYYSSLEYNITGVQNDFIEGNDDGSGVAYGLGLNYGFDQHGISFYYDVLPTLNFEANDKVKTTGIGLAYRYTF